jgi:hypothetical protein
MRSRGYVTRGTASLVAACLASRVLVLAAGIAAAAFGSRVGGWATVDTQRVSASFGPVGNALAAATVRWDALAYTGIAAHGYTTKISTTFFPLYPLTIRAVDVVARSYTVAGIAISLVSFAVAMVLIHRLTELELDRRAADATVLLLAFAPVSFFFTAIYTESLFLALSVGAVLAARRGRPALAGGLAALATVTRVTGILLVVPCALLLVGDGRWWDRRQWRDRRLAWLLLAPAALLVFLAYLANRGYGWLAPLHNQVAHHFSGPFVTVGNGARDAWHSVTDVVSGTSPYSPSLVGPFTPHFDSLVLLAVLAIALVALVAVFRRLPAAYGAYALLALLVVIFSETKIQPLEGLDRYALTIFPLWMGAAAWLAERRAVRPVVIAGAALLAFYSYQFATWAFIA